MFLKKKKKKRRQIIIFIYKPKAKTKIHKLRPNEYQIRL